MYKIIDDKPYNIEHYQRAKSCTIKQVNFSNNDIGQYVYSSRETALQGANIPVALFHVKLKNP